jgi:two-component system response regulator GlrR
MRILVVDDELPIMQLCVKVLEDQGHTVEGFSRGESLLARLAEGPADLLVVDYKMPGLNGVQVVGQARDLYPGIRVVMITGHGTSEVLAEAHDAGVTGVLLKPFTPAALIEAVNHALGVSPSPAAFRP